MHGNVQAKCQATHQAMCQAMHQTMHQATHQAIYQATHQAIYHAIFQAIWLTTDTQVCEAAAQAGRCLLSQQAGILAGTNAGMAAYVAAVMGARMEVGYLCTNRWGSYCINDNISEWGDHRHGHHQPQPRVAWPLAVQPELQLVKDSLRLPGNYTADQHEVQTNRVYMHKHIN